MFISYLNNTPLTFSETWNSEIIKKSWGFMKGNDYTFEKKGLAVIIKVLFKNCCKKYQKYDLES